MKKICFILILFPNLIFSQSWLNVANFIGDGRHHPITFSNDNYGFVVSGSYLNDVFKSISYVLALTCEKKKILALLIIFIYLPRIN